MVIFKTIKLYMNFIFTSVYAMRETQKVFDGRGIVKDPQQNTIKGNGVERIDAFFI